MKKLLYLLLFITTRLSAQLPDSTEVDYQLKNFTFTSGETLPVLRLHYTTFGKPIKDKSGKVINAVYIMHGTTGNSHNFTNNLFAGHLFQPGQLLDATKYFIILPDGIGHGKSSKPSDGLHMKFPKYTYDDMVKADYTVLTQQMGINHLRLILGTSMGAMHCWVWAETYPDFMDACMANASEPVRSVAVIASAATPRSNASKQTRHGKAENIRNHRWSASAAL